MNRIEHINRLLALIGLLAFPGCAMTLSSPTATTRIASLTYEAPASIDLKRVVDILEQSSRITLRKPVTIDEGTSDPLETGILHPVILRETVTDLEGLGTIIIPSISCPGALASMHTLMPSKPGLRLIAGCVVATDRGARIYLTETATGEPADSRPSDEATASSLLLRIGAALAERLPELYPVDGPSIPIHRITGPTRDREGRRSGDLDRAEGTAAADHNDLSIHATPVLCFAPKEKSMVVRDYPGSNGIVGTLGSDLIVQKEEPGKNAFFHVTTREGRIGWIKRSDVRWTACPIA